MKFQKVFYLFTILIISACNSTNKQAGTGDVTDKKEVAELPQNFYKRLTGTLNGKPIVLHLQKINGEYDGEYYTDSYWINLETDTLVGKDSLVLTENSFYNSYFETEPKQAHLYLKWTGNGFKGMWENAAKTQKHPVLLEEKYPKGSYEFSAGIYQDSVQAFADQPKSPKAHVSFEYLKPKKKDEGGAWLDNQLKQISGIKLDAFDRETGFKKITDAYFADYKKQMEEENPAGSDKLSNSWMNYTNNSQQSIVYNENNYVIIDFLADTYTGGAHGNYSSTLYCLDVQNKKQMALVDVLKISAITLQQLLESNLRKQYNIKPKKELNTVLFENFLKPSKNFYFNRNGLAFMYNPYEVASYAQGQLVVFIPFTELKPYLVPAFANRIGLN